MSELVQRYTASVDFDRRLWRADIDGSLAHAEMLAAQGVISPQDHAAIEHGMAQIVQEIEAGAFDGSWRGRASEHQAPDQRWATPAALHTGRSRNEGRHRHPPVARGDRPHRRPAAGCRARSSRWRRRTSTSSAGFTTAGGAAITPHPCGYVGCSRARAAHADAPASTSCRWAAPRRDHLPLDRERVETRHGRRLQSNLDAKSATATAIRVRRAACWSGASAA